MDVDLTRLRYFLAVAEERHFKHAADRLLITAPPLSKQIKLLENELGGTLFERSYHKVALTPLGEALVEPVREILQRVDDLRSLTSVMTHQGAPMRFGATGYAPSEYLDMVHAVLDDVEIKPDATFVISGSSAEVVAQLISGHLDLGLIHLPATDERVDTEGVIELRGAIAVRAGDPLADRASVTVDDIKDREVAIDFAWPNQYVLNNLTRRLSALGFTRIVRSSTISRPGDLEIAAQTKARGLVTLASYTPHSTIGRIFSAPDFALIPIDDERWVNDPLALAWSRAHAEKHPEILAAARVLAAAIRAH